MKLLVTGVAGFITFFDRCKSLELVTKLKSIIEEGLL